MPAVTLSGLGMADDPFLFAHNWLYYSLPFHRRLRATIPFRPSLPICSLRRSLCAPRPARPSSPPSGVPFGHPALDVETGLDEILRGPPALYRWRPERSAHRHPILL